MITGSCTESEENVQLSYFFKGAAFLDVLGQALQYSMKSSIPYSDSENFILVLLVRRCLLILSFYTVLRNYMLKR